MSLPVSTRNVSIVSDEAEARALDAAWRDLLPARKAEHQAYEAFSRANDRLPAWAKAGPSRVRHDGSYTGPIVGFPELPDVGLPANPGTVRIVRPSLREVWYQHTYVHKQFGVGDRRTIHRNAVAAVRRWHARLKEREALEVELGITAAEAESERCGILADPFFKRIDELLRGSSHAAVASNLLMSGYFALEPREKTTTPQHTIREQLQYILPRLTGIVAVLASDFLRRDGRVDGDFLIYTGMDEREIEEAAPSHHCAQPDRLLALIRDYRAGMAAYDAAKENTDEQDVAMKDASWGPLYERLMDAPPRPTTAEGALAAVRLALEEERDCGSQPALTIALLEAAMSYFEPADVAAAPEADAA